MKHKKPRKPPKPRGTWQINPKTRVKPSSKIYKRSEEKKKTPKAWVAKVNWFGTKNS